MHPTINYPPRIQHETFFNDKDPDNEQDQDRLPQIPLASPVAVTSSTRTDFTWYLPIEVLTRMLQKYAKNANLQKLSYPTNLVSRQQQFATFMNNLCIVSTSALFATYHHGHAKSLTFGPNKSATLIHALVQASTTWSLHAFVILVRNTLLTSTWCQNCHLYSETSLRTAQPRSHWPHARIVLFHKTRTPRSCNIIPEPHLYTIPQLLSRRNSKHRRRTNQTSHPWRQQSPHLCCILPLLWLQHPLCQTTWWRTSTTFCRTWEPPFEYWWLM